MASADSIAIAQTTGAALAISGSPPTTIVAGSALRFTPAATGGQRSRRFFTVRNRPAWASFDWRTGTLSGAPSAGQVGTYANVRISVTDFRTTASLPPFTLAVVSAPSSPATAPAPSPDTTSNQAPRLGGTPAPRVTSGTAYAFQPTASDADGEALTFTIQGRPAWATFSPTTGRLSGTPAAGDVGTYTGISIVASDGKSLTALPAFSIEVIAAATTATNRGPTITGAPPTRAVVAQPYSFQPIGIDPDGDMIAYGISNKPIWASFNTTTGQLSGTPTATEVGIYPNVIIAVSDSRANATLPPFSIVVAAAAGTAVTLTWEPPTLNTDGTPLTSLAGYRIRYGTSPSSLTQMVSVLDPSRLSHTLHDLAAGTWYFSIEASNREGVMSEPSTVVSHTVF